jgi:hypothetical protein
MAQFDLENQALVGAGGQLPVRLDDEITRKLSMLIEGECEGLGPLEAARKFGFSKQRYFQLRAAFSELGAQALQSHKRGPKTHYRRTAEVVRQVIRHRFLDPEASAEVIAQKLLQSGWAISIRSVQRVIEEFGLQKKLYQCRPKEELTIETQRTRRRTRAELCDPASLERSVRQLLADKVSGNLVGLWLLIPEHLRLGTWDLLCGWTGRSSDRIEPRLALQLIHEAALCSTGLREQRVLSQRGFELANGLPFVASDTAIHLLLAEHTVAESQRLQVALGRIRRASGDYVGKLLAIDPHRMHSYSKRQMRRYRDDQKSRPYKAAPTFFALDPDTHQPVCFTTATSARTATTAAIELLELAAEILTPKTGETLVMADLEHLTAELFHHVQLHTPFDLLVPMKNERSLQKKLRAIPAEQFTRRWAGFATMKQPYQMAERDAGSLFQFVQRTGERPDDYRLGAFLSTTDREEVDTLTLDYPKRWHVEEFFNAHQALGWKRAGTMNLNIRYGQMTMALLAQASLHQLRRRLGEPFSAWDASHLARSLLAGLEGDVRVKEDTILVTYYNAPNAERLRAHYEGLPDRLESEHIDPQVPWLCGFKLDFCFR